MLPTSYRIRGRKVFLLLNRYSKRMNSRFFSILYLLNKKNEKTKFAVVITKQVFKQANQRNRVRRRMWAAITKNHSLFPDRNYLLEFKIKSGLLGAPWLDLVDSVKWVAGKLPRN